MGHSIQTVPSKVTGPPRPLSFIGERVSILERRLVNDAFDPPTPRVLSWPDSAPTRKHFCVGAQVQRPDSVLSGEINAKRDHGDEVEASMQRDGGPEPSSSVADERTGHTERKECRQKQQLKMHEREDK